MVDVEESLTPEEVIARERTERSGQLALAHASLGVVPEGVFELSHLTKLYLHSNKLTSVPASIGQLSQLTVLFLQENELVALPRELGLLRKLTRLRLEKNRLQTLPEEIGQLTLLTELRIEENALRDIPAAIGSLTKLREFRATHNRLRALPTSLGGISSLALMPGKFQVVGGNGLDLLPPAVVQRGDAAILEHLANEYASHAAPKSEPDTTASAEDSLVREVKELHERVRELRSKHDTLHAAIVDHSATLSHSLAMRDALTAKVAKVEEDKSKPADKLAGLIAQRDSFDASVVSLMEKLDGLLAERGEVAVQLAPLEARLTFLLSGPA